MADLLLAAAVVACLATGLFRILSPAPPLPAEAFFSALPEGLSLGPRETAPFPHYPAALPGSGRGAVVLTDDLPPRVPGYNGPLTLAVGVTGEGKLSRVVLARHGETAYYIELLLRSGFLEGFTGLDLALPFPAFSPDAVTGATVSARAIHQEVRGAARASASALFGTRVPPAMKEAPGPWFSWKTPLLLAVLAAGAAAALRPPSLLLRWSAWGLGLSALGFLLNAPLTLANLGRLMSLDLPGGDNPVLILPLAFLLLTLPLQGRAWCRHLCPFGALQEGTARLLPPAWRDPPGFSAAKPFPVLRRLLLGVLLLLAVPLGMPGFLEAEPFFALFSLTMSPLLWILTGTVLILSLFRRRFWCNALCPTGTLLAAVCRLFPWRRGRDETV